MPNPVKPVVNVNKWDGEDEDEIKVSLKNLITFDKMVKKRL